MELADTLATAPGVGDCIPAPRSFGLKPLTVGIELPDPGAVCIS